ncbi:papain-like cysteine protease family protein [Raoultibacter phocaeensis]|uniref:papain-like cysteine protease family protein n=1 Tax=Raoultibacter phocaeensis TaxID=2479841 RepID=UPI0011184506|nr:papain-like cysteine protease family protein [Raoultibacter phocaeensis]
MGYPHKLYLSFHSCGYRVVAEPEGAHAEAPHAETAPCGAANPEQHPQKRMSRFNWTGEAKPYNPALLSPVEGYRERRRQGRRKTIGAFVVLVALAVFGIATVSFGITQSGAEDMDGSGVFSNNLPLLPSAETEQATRTVRSTPLQDWEQGTIPQLYQRDPQWATQPYASSTLGSCGQGPLCMAMAYAAVTGSRDALPTDISALIEAAGYASNASTDAAFIPATAEALGLEADEIKLDESSIRKAIIAGKPVICSMVPGDFGEQRTFIVLADIDMDSKLTVRDPSSDARSSVGWDFETVISQAESMWALSSPVAG